MLKTATVGKTGKELVKTISFSCNPELYRTMTNYISDRGCSRSWFLSKALESYLAECLEDKEDYETAVAAYERFEKSGEKGIPLEEARKRLGV